jgi:hypothetical protein
LPPREAGVGSVINDVAGETGGTLRVAIIGSVYTLARYQPADHRGDRSAARRPGRHQDLGRSRIRDRPPRSTSARTPTHRPRAERVPGRAARWLRGRRRCVSARDRRSRSALRRMGRWLASSRCARNRMSPRGRGSERHPTRSEA